MKYIALFIAALLVSGCAMIPSYESQKLKKRKLEIALVEKQLEQEKDKKEINKCDAIKPPGDAGFLQSNDIAWATYYTALAGCTSGGMDANVIAAITGNSTSPSAAIARDIEKTRRVESNNRWSFFKSVKDSFLAVLGMGVDLHIADEDRKSRNQDQRGSITVGRDYVVGSHNQDNDTAETNDSSQDNSTVDNNSDNSTVDNTNNSSNDHTDSYNQDHTGYNQDNDVDSNDQTTNTDSNDDNSQDNDVDSNDDNRVIDSHNTDSFNNPIPEPVEDEG